MREVPEISGLNKKTKDDLINLYVNIIKDKARFQYDLKRVIFELVPYLKSLYTVFIPKKGYSLSQSKEDFGSLEIREHRFINFLRFTTFSENEIKKIFRAHEEIMNSVEPPERFQYSKEELYSFLKVEAHDSDISRDVYQNQLKKHISYLVTQDEIEDLYKD